MLDIKKIQSDPVGMAKKMAAKGVTIDFAELIEKYERRKSINAENDALRNRRKTISKKIGIAMKNGSPDGEALAQEVKEVNEKIKANEALIAEIDQYVNKLMLELPNPPVFV